jgi:MinD superfamily P-loop ATPase
MIEVCRRLEVPCGVVINRSFGEDREVESLCKAKGVPVLLKVPFDRKVAEVYAKGGTLLEAMPELAERLNEVFFEIMGLKR